MHNSENIGLLDRLCNKKEYGTSFSIADQVQALNPKVINKRQVQRSKNSILTTAIESGRPSEIINQQVSMQNT